jgi:hypothetical protein
MEMQLMEGKKINMERQFYLCTFEREGNGRTQKGEFCLPYLETGRKWKELEISIVKIT